MSGGLGGLEGLGSGGLGVWGLGAFPMGGGSGQASHRGVSTAGLIALNVLFVFGLFMAYVWTMNVKVLILFGPERESAASTNRTASRGGGFTGKQVFTSARGL